MKLLIIRPEPGASISAERAREAGMTPVVLPFFEVQAVAWQQPDPADYDALLLTSANAVRLVAQGWKACARFRCTQWVSGPQRRLARRG